MAFSHTLMSDLIALLVESLFGEGDVGAFEALTPVPMYRAKARTGRRRRARPERLCSYNHAELVTSTTKRGMDAIPYTWLRAQGAPSQYYQSPSTTHVFPCTTHPLMEGQTTTS